MDATAPERRKHIDAELGQVLAVAGDELVGTAEVTPHVAVPGTTCLRTSVLATYADHVAGLLVGQSIAPRVGMTLDLDVHLHRPPRDVGSIRVVGRPLKTGRLVTVIDLDLTADGVPVGTAVASFMAAPDARLTLSPIADSIAASNGYRVRLEKPFAERAGCERRGPGEAVLAVAGDSINASNTINGGLIALAVEEAALSATPGATLSSLSMRYLRAARVGPVVATAEVVAGLGRVEVRDAGNDNRLVVLATTRVFPPG